MSTQSERDSADRGLPAIVGLARRAIRPVMEIRAIRRTYDVLVTALGRMYQDDGWAMASHLALSALMALFPFLIFVAAVAGLIGQQQLADQAASLLFEAWPAEVAGPIANEVHNVLTRSHGSIITISVVVTIYLASNGVEAVRAALTRAYGTGPYTRSFIFLRLQSIGFVIIGALACLALALLGVLGPLIWELVQRSEFVQRVFPSIADYRGSFEILRYGVTGILLGTALTAAHLWLPSKRRKGLRLWPGILATLVLWWIATAALATYLSTFANYVSTYAGLAGVVTVIFYLYVMALILILGAEVNAALFKTSPRRRAEHAGAGLPQLGAQGREVGVEPDHRADAGR
jgi:membrane protein